MVRKPSCLAVLKPIFNLFLAPPLGPYRFIGFGGIDVTKPYKFMCLGGIDAPKSYEFIGSGGFYFANTGISSNFDAFPQGGLVF